MPAPHARRRRDPRTIYLFARRLVREFRWTLALLMMAVLLLGTLYAVTPLAALGGHRPDPFASFFSAWMALFAQTLLPAERWYLEILCGVYPLLGFGLVGEGVVRIGMLILSKERGEKEWMTVMASTYRDHVVLCGLGHLGFRILGQLLATKEAVVALEKDANARFLGDAKATGVPVLVRDMQEDQALVDARVMNPKSRGSMRLFDQRMADKFKEAALIDEAFSPAALAAPIVAEMALTR